MSQSAGPRISHMIRAGFAIDSVSDGVYIHTAKRGITLVNEVNRGWKKFWAKRGIDASKIEDEFRNHLRERSESAAAESES